MSPRPHPAALAAGFLALLMAGCTGNGGDASQSADTTTEIFHSNPFGMYRGLVYVPASANRGAPVPLVVVLHGANTTAEQERAVTLFDQVAAREGFIVVYPDHETDSALGLHPLQSWHVYDPLESQRGIGDAEALANLTLQVIEGWNVDPERVYVVGVSAGGWMTSILGATYPDLYAAIGIVEAGGYLMGTALIGVGQPIGPTLVPPDVTALAAYLAMGPRARVVPMINFQGDEDPAATPASGAQAVQQWLRTNNLVVSGSTTSPFPLAPTETIDVMSDAPDRYPYHVDIYRDDAGCEIVRQVRIEQMAHYWPGGSDDPALAGFADPKAPSGAELSWAFLKKFRRSDTSPPCTESRS
jgi:poly(hydroxyalkanoate) depolymerase family esterase